MAEFEEKCDGIEDAMAESCDGVSEVRKNFVGVSRSGKKWRARVRHPTLKVDVHIGSYSSREEAAFAVAKKKAEFEEMLKGEDGMTVETCEDDFEGRKLPVGVYRRGHGRWCARIWHPKLKKRFSLGNYESVEEAAAAVNKKRAEFQEMYWWKIGRARFIPDCNDEVLEKPVRELTSTSEFLEKSETKLICTSKSLNERTKNVKVPAGVIKVKSGRWVARIDDRIKSSKNWLGSYDTAEEAARSFNSKKAMLAAKRKRAELSEGEFRHKERAVNEVVPEFGYQLQTPDTEELKSTAVGEKSKCGVTDVPCKLEYNIDRSSPISAIEPDISSSADVSDKTILSQENCRETACVCDFDEVRNHFVGVSKSGKKWRARVRHPKLKIDVYIGSYNSREEAAFAVAKKKAEFENMLKGEGIMCAETCNSCKDDFEGRKLPFGVYRRGYERWCARVWHPKLKKLVSLGNYKSAEEATAAVNKKRAEFQDMYWWKPVRARFIPDCKDDDDEVLEKPESELLSASKSYDEWTGDAEVPAGVMKVKSGRWVARINDRIKRPRIWLGSYDIAEEAARSFNRKKAMLAAKMKMAEFSHKERAVSEAQPEFGYLRQTPDTEESKSIADGEKSKCGVTDVPCKLEYNFAQSSPSSAIEPDISSSADVSDKIILSQENCRETACTCDFDDAVRLGFIDEYGQLLGMFSELDEQMGLETV